MADTTDSTSSSTDAAPTPSAGPTVITLDTPYTTGDLAPDEKFPHVYITTFYVNGPALTMNCTYEYGTMGAGGWVKAPYAPTTTVSFQDAELYPFFSRLPNSVSTPLWDQVEQGLYEQVQERDGRAAGKVGPLVTPTASSST